MSSCTFLEVVNWSDEVKCVNPEWIKRIEKYSEDQTTLVFGVDDYLIVKHKYEDIIKCLAEANYFIKQIY